MMHSKYLWVMAALVGAGMSGCGGGSARGSANVEVADVMSASSAPTRTAAQSAAVSQVSAVSALQDEIRQLRNMLEEQQFEVENMKQRQQDLYQGLDERLRVTETRQLSTSPAYGASAALGESKSATLPQAAQVPEAPLDTATQATVGANNAAKQTGDAPAISQVAVSGDQQQLYDQGFEFLRQSDYSSAIVVFEQLVRQHPDAGLADDASYWIGEANYVNRQYGDALKAFRSVIAQYPSSDRVPEALLKIGYVEYDIGDYDKAAATFEDLIARYPDHNVTISAQSRLLRIQRGLTN